MDIVEPDHAAGTGPADAPGAPSAAQLLADVNALALKVAWLETMLEWELEQLPRASGLRSCIISATRSTKTAGPAAVSTGQHPPAA